MSSLPQPKTRFTVDEYLTLERASKVRHIYLDGELYAMAGENFAHGGIAMNLSGIVYHQLKGSPCQARSKDTKVRSGRTPLSGHGMEGFFSYPDLVVICGEPEFHDAYRDVVLNPTAILEVLSPSTEAFDRGEKFTRFQTWNPTLTDYVLVSQDRPRIEHFQRQADGSWLPHCYVGLDRSLTIGSIHCTLMLADVHERITFATE